MAKVDRMKLSENQDRRIKLTKEMKDTIKHRYQTEDISIRALAREYQVSPNAILIIVNPKSKAKQTQYAKERAREHPVPRDVLTARKRKIRAYKQELYLQYKLK